MFYEVRRKELLYTESTVRSEWGEDSRPNIQYLCGCGFKETMRIALTYAALNDLDLFAADIENAYLKAHFTEKYYTRYGS